MTPPELKLPDDIEALKAMVLALAEKAGRAEVLVSEVADLKARNADADERIERLTQILKAFDRPRFGRRSEKLGSPTIDDEQQAFVFEEIETGIAAIRAQVNKGRERPDGKRPPRPRKGFAPHLERVEVVVDEVWGGAEWGLFANSRTQQFRKPFPYVRCRERHSPGRVPERREEAFTGVCSIKPDPNQRCGTGNIDRRLARTLK